MQLETIRYSRSHGWSTESFPELDSERTVVLVFADPGFRHDMGAIQEVCRAYPRSHVLGCSTSGQIFQAEVTDGSLAVAIARFDHTEIATAVAQVSTPSESHAAGLNLVSQLTRDDLKAVLVLSDGLNVNGSDLVEGLTEALPPSVVVTGGLAGDGDRFEQTWVLEGGAPATGAITAVGLYGDHVRVGHGSKGGWDSFGPERMVTRSAGNVLFELDGRPALQLYKEYLGERASGLPATALLFPLALREEGDGHKTLVRTVLSVDEAEQSMTFAGNIPQGHTVQLMRANFERLIGGASEAALMVEAADAANTLAIAISCVGRRLILGERTEEEIEAALDEFGPGTRQVGFYSYGEISPYASGHCDLHNQTMTLTTISEA